jgi:hypothetical protein
MYIRNLSINKILYVVTGLFALIAAGWGVLSPAMYEPVVEARILPGVFTQDLVVVLAAVLMIGLAVRLKSDDYRSLVIILGILGFLFYAYGIYAIEQVYIQLYPMYLAILALSFYTLAYSLVSLNLRTVEALQLPAALRYGTAGYGIFIAIMFNIIWLSQLIPLLQTHDRVEYTFSVYIIDLVFIMPSFVIMAILLIRKRGLGIVGMPAMFILGVGILSPLAFGELLAPVRFGRPMNMGEFWLFGSLSLVFLILALIYLIALKAVKHADIQPA